ncbi:hypothetical protein PM3016_401 [Paenibacillus mucilaginosus 3016]|uniref:Uncharacterized protein n=1 Tax=Paenibacillus mucilaginosus 3016 TaxID=1116391 RepID=H6NS79_9BACL|nr:hypothetical protein PM3016_401 [Paenibacillus mucilaginosus 3016]
MNPYLGTWIQRASSATDHLPWGRWFLYFLIRGGTELETLKIEEIIRQLGIAEERFAKWCEELEMERPDSSEDGQAET